MAEVRDAQTKEANGLKREQTALKKSLADVDATYDASVKTLETQLLLLLRSKLQQGMLCCFSAITGQVGPEALKIKPLGRQRCPLFAAFWPIGQVLRW